MEGALCKIQYVGKAETAFNARLTNHIKIYAIQNLSIPAYLYFRKNGHSFKVRVQFLLALRTH